MLNSGKKFEFRATKKNILTLVLSEQNFLNETKNHNPPCKLNGRSITCIYRYHKSTLSTVYIYRSQINNNLIMKQHYIFTCTCIYIYIYIYQLCLQFIYSQIINTLYMI